jgi:hypothetical protein
MTDDATSLEATTKWGNPCVTPGCDANHLKR